MSTGDSSPLAHMGGERPHSTSRFSRLSTFPRQVCHAANERASLFYVKKRPVRQSALRADGRTLTGLLKVIEPVLECSLTTCKYLPLPSPLQTFLKTPTLVA